MSNGIDNRLTMLCKPTDTTFEDNLRIDVVVCTISNLDKVVEGAVLL